MESKLTGKRRFMGGKSDGAIFNKVEFRALAQKQAQLLTDLMVCNDMGHHKILAVLTPEQCDLEERTSPLLD